MDEQPKLPRVSSGTRQATVGAIANLSILQAGFLAYTAVNEPGPWTLLGLLSVLCGLIELCLLTVSLWRALAVEDDYIPVYRVTRKWIGASMLAGILSLTAFALSLFWEPAPLLSKWLNTVLA